MINWLSIIYCRSKKSLWHDDLRSAKLNGCITSLELMESPSQRGVSRKLLAATRSSEIYALSVDTLAPVLCVTCHRCAINDIAFPRGMSGVFVTAGSGDVRVWCLETCQELLRISVPNFTCSSVLFSGDGKSIVSGWNDGTIRAFTPLTGRLMYAIFNTHNKGTSALAMNSKGNTLISGGCEGQVRVWDIKPEKQILKKVLKEHKSPVSAIQVSPNDCEAVSAGTDGSCIIWDLMSLSRRQVMYASTLFMCVCFEPLGCQLLTGGTDRRVAYWEAGSGNLARELEASKVGAVNGLDISSDGQLFVTGCNDQIVKVWKYQEGIYTHMGLGHAGAVTCAKFSPDRRFVVSSCAAGSIIVWRTPEIYLQPEKPSQPSSAKQTQEQDAQEGERKAQTLEDELKLPLADKPEQREEKKKAAGDRQHRVPAAPSKIEKIQAMDTTRSSVHSCCPCDTVRSAAGAARSPADSGKKGKAADKTNNLPTKTTSKEFVSGGGGDKK